MDATSAPTLERGPLFCSSTLSCSSVIPQCSQAEPRPGEPSLPCPLPAAQFTMSLGFPSDSASLDMGSKAYPVSARALLPSHPQR